MAQAKPKPKGALSTDPAELKKQQAHAQGLLDRRTAAGKESPGLTKRLNKINGALGTDPSAGVAPAPAPTPALPGQDDFIQTTDNARESLNGTFDEINAQGAFNPGDYAASRQAASDSVMNEFNRQNQGRFQQEDQQFAQQMADQGIDENSPKYQFMKQQYDLNRGNQIQGAQNSAFQAGQGEQAQAFGQAATTYQMPLNKLNALSPFYGYDAQARMQNNQFQWQGGQNDSDRQLQIEMQKAGFDYNDKAAQQQFKWNKQLASMNRGGGGGGGGGGVDPYAADRKFYDSQVNAALNNGQPPTGGAQQGATQGFTNGAAIAIGSGLRGGSR